MADQFDPKQLHQIPEVETAEADDRFALDRPVGETNFVLRHIRRSNLLKGLVRQNGTVPFTAAQAGVAPEADADLVTKLYSDLRTAGFEIVGAPADGQTLIFDESDGKLHWATPEGGDVFMDGQSGGTVGRVIRPSGAANTWVDAANTDTTDQLSTLAFRTAEGYVSIPRIVNPTLGTLTIGAPYYLGTDGQITGTAPEPSATVHRVFIGTAITADEIVFRPGVPIKGEDA